MSQNLYQLDTSSSKLYFVTRSTDVRNHVQWQQMKQEEASWEYLLKNVAYEVNHSVVCPEPPPHFTSVISTTL